MQSLVSDLLNFSRVGRAHNAHQSIGLVTVLEETLPALGVAVEETGAEITHAPLFTLVADPRQMVMPWQNLIGNAVTFHRPEETPRIREPQGRRRAPGRCE